MEYIGSFPKLQTMIWELKATFENQCIWGWSQKLRWYRQKKGYLLQGWKKNWTILYSSAKFSWVQLPNPGFMNDCIISVSSPAALFWNIVPSASYCSAHFVMPKVAKKNRNHTTSTRSELWRAWRVHHFHVFPLVFFWSFHGELF